MDKFNNTKIAFASKSTNDLRVSKVLFSIMRYNKMVKIGKFLYSFSRKIHFPVNWIIKPTIYDHFVGGATLESCLDTVKLLHKSNVKSILDYSAEGAKGEKGIQDSFDEIIKSIDYSGKTRGVAYSVFKPSTMTFSNVLKKYSFGEEMTEEETMQYDKFVERMDALANRAYEKGVRLLVDAEHYSYQKAFDDVCEMLMAKYNTERCVIFNTLQMYRHDRMDYLRKLHADAKEQGYKVGVKFVRGAYMEDERALALELGYEDPICKDKQTTDDNYNNGLVYCMKHLDDFEIFCGTHNTESTRLLTKLIDEAGIAHDDERIYFSQLYGMSDNLTFVLAYEKFNVAKYIPYADIDSVIPYLLRRADENTSIEGQTNRELDLLTIELKRRKSEK